MRHGLRQDVRDARRSIARAPAFALAVVGSLALGIGAMTAAFTVVNTVALRPPAGIHRPGSMVQVSFQRHVSGTFQNASTAETLAAVRGQFSALTDVAAFHPVDMVVGVPAEPQDLSAMVVSGNFFEVLGVQPLLGRLLTASDDRVDGAHPVAVLSHHAWVQHFGSDAAVVGATLRVNGRPMEIVGVAAEGFTGVRVEFEEDPGPAVWIPLSMRGMVPRPSGDLRLQLIGRLREGAARDDAEAEAAVLASRVIASAPGQPTPRAVVTPLGGNRATPVELLAFMAVPAIVLALACVNAANLLTSRASRRVRDAAVRISLGATAWRLVRQLLVESLLLSLAAAAGGVAITYGLVALFERYMPIRLTVDWRVLAFAAGTAALTAFAFGLAPAVATAGRAGDLVSRVARRRGSRTRTLLIAAQAALSLALIATGWQFINTVRTQASADGLSDVDRLIVGSLDVGKLPWPPADVHGYYARVGARIAALPGVSTVAFTCACDPWGRWAPGDAGGSLRFWLPSTPAASPSGALAMYAGGPLLEALGLTMAEGRTFAPEDHDGPLRTVLVNRPFAEQYLGPEAVGQSLRIATTREDFGAARTVVVAGVVEPPSARRTDAVPMIYYPSPLHAMGARTMLIRFEGRASERVALVHAALREVSADAPRPEILTGEQARWQRNSARQFIAACVSLLGVIALILAAAGLYGVVAFVVTLRHHEIAVRMALGAAPAAVVRLIVRQALTPAVFGAVLGACGAVATGLLVRSRLYGASPVDPVAIGGALMLLLGVLVVASTLPARRAARIDPMAALKSE